MLKIQFLLHIFAYMRIFFNK